MNESNISSPKPKRNPLITIGIIAAFIAISVFGRNFFDKTEITKAEVTNISLTWNTDTDENGNPEREIFYKFTADGTEYTSSYKSFDKYIEIGDTVRISYDRKSPRRSKPY